MQLRNSICARDEAFEKMPQALTSLFLIEINGLVESYAAKAASIDPYSYDQELLHHNQHFGKVIHKYKKTNSPQQPTPPPQPSHQESTSRTFHNINYQETENDNWQQQQQLSRNWTTTRTSGNVSQNLGMNLLGQGNNGSSPPGYLPPGNYP